MALATTCPQCNTSFKVVPDQLKLRRGLVRCGTCQHVFSGVDYLRYIADSKPGSAPAGDGDGGEALHTAFFLPETILAAPGTQHAPVPESIAQPAEDAPAMEDTLPAREVPSGEDVPSAEGTPPVEDESPPEGMPLAEDVRPAEDVPTAEDASPAELAQALEAALAAEAARIEQEAVASEPSVTEERAIELPVIEIRAAEEADTIESLTATMPTGFGHPDAPLEPHAAASLAAPWEDGGRPPYHDGRVEAGPATSLAGEDDEEPAIDYFSTGRRGVGFIDRHGPIAMVAAVLLALALALQWIVTQRAMIAARAPALAPAMSLLFEPFGLRLEPPRDLASLTIESFELQASATPGILSMSALLRNRADYRVQWPSMELTLTDAGQRVLVRKVLGPQDYLGGTGADGLPPRAERPLRLALEARDLQPAGYSVALFYP